MGLLLLLLSVCFVSVKNCTLCEGLEDKWLEKPDVFWKITIKLDFSKSAS